MSEPERTDRSEAASPSGLRERSKAKRRLAIQRAALTLFAEKGYDETTIAEIAEAAEVAPRTISSYFASKVDLATSVAGGVTARFVATFVANPDASFLDVVDRWLSEEEQFTDREFALLAKAAYQRNPALRSLVSSHLVEAMEVGRAALAAEFDLPGDDPMMTISAAAIGATIAAYFGIIREHGTTPQLHQSLLQFLQGMLNGLVSS